MHEYVTTIANDLLQQNCIYKNKHERKQCHFSLQYNMYLNQVFFMSFMFLNNFIMQMCADAAIP